MTLNENINLPIILTYYYKGSITKPFKELWMHTIIFDELAVSLYDNSNRLPSNTENTLQEPI